MDLSPFNNRLKKQFKHLSKWARKNDISCYRIYDKDLPDFPVTIDWYDGSLYVCNVAPYRKEEDRFTDTWLESISSEAARILGVQSVHTRRREKQSQEKQYEKLDNKKLFYSHRTWFKF